MSPDISESQCLTLAPCSFDLASTYDHQHRIERATRWHIEDMIASTEHDIQIFRSTLLLDSTELQVIEFINEIRDSLLNKFDFVYSEVPCWRGVDSLLAYHTSSNFLIGPDPGIPVDHPKSAYQCQQTLETHLQALDPNLVVIIFPSYRHNLLEAYTPDGTHVQWCIHNFFRVSLGQALIELNRTKLKILQLKALELRETVGNTQKIP